MDELGEISGSGKKFLWQVEKGQSNFTIDNIEILLKSLHLSLEQLVITKYLTENAVNNH
jgi:hypothetical protein